MKTPGNQSILRQFEELEKRVERLIGFLVSQKEKTLALKKRIDELEGELRNQAEVEKRYVKERTLIRSKIDNLLIKLDDISGEI